MSATYVAVDVETTGLDPVRDSIIEVAAVTFRGNDILDEFDSLVNPERPFSHHITQLTGITPEMAAAAPTMFNVRPILKRHLADHVLVGHNVGFDLSFLRQAQLALSNRTLDTLTLATILVPEAGRFSLEALSDHLRLPARQNAHRARADAEQTIELFLALRERALALSLAQLEEIVLAGRRLDWPEAMFFEDVMTERARDAFEKPELRQRGRLAKLFGPPELEGRPLVPPEKPHPLDVDWLVSLIDEEGHFSQVFPEFEHRPQQIEMMIAVADAFNRGQHVLVEAGTGTGKSIGYLLPAVFWATENDRRVVISTNTINLQDQLMHKDIPELQRLLNLDLRAVVRKGRSNYICTRLFQQMRRSGPGDRDEMNLYARILLWLPRTKTGDMAELSLRTTGERLTWSKLNAENPVCTAEVCAGENCPFNAVRRQSELAHIVVVNHALLLADMATEGNVLPDYLDLIIDEAHHLEDAVTRGLSFEADRRSLDAILDEISRTRGGLAANAQQRIGAAAPGAIAAEVDAHIEKMRAVAQTASYQLEEFFTTLHYFLQGLAQGSNQFAQQIRLTYAVRTQPDYNYIEESWANLNGSFKSLARGFTRLAEAVGEIARLHDIEDGDDLQAALMNSGMTLEESRRNIDALISSPSEDMIYWVELFRDAISLHAAPLHVGPLVSRHIFDAKEAVIMTSATLQTAGYAGEEPSFAYLRDRLNAHHTDELAVGSPFDYKNSTLLYLVSDIPEPNQPGYQQAVEQAIIDTAVTLGGRTMALFTANNQLAQTAQSIEGRLATYDIVTLAQGAGSSRQQLLEQFRREGGRSVLLGTRSFWEGVDVPGDALLAVIIAKLPFDVPSDPIFAARSETYENPFYEYSIPEAVLRFRQGFGRLIRRKSDEGVVIILDKRVLTKRYGQLFLDALPECTIVRQRRDRLNELLVRWFNRDRERRR